MTNFYLSSSGIALWMNDKGEDYVIAKIFIVLNSFSCGITVNG